MQELKVQKYTVHWIIVKEFTVKEYTMKEYTVKEYTVQELKGVKTAVACRSVIAPQGPATGSVPASCIIINQARAALADSN